MKTTEIIVNEKVVFDAKMAGEIVTALSHISSNIFIMSGNARVNAKSIIGVISLALKPGDKIVVTAQGEDEVTAVDAVQKILG